MIEHTFSFLQGIGEVTEQRLWREGILTWDDFLAAQSISFFSAEKKHFYNDILLRARQSLKAGELIFFLENVRQREHWRLWPNFRDRAVALDIETNGLPVSGGGYATMVGLYDGCDFRALVQGRDLTRERLEQEFSRYRYLVSFFGAGFDVPFLREAFSVHWVGLHYDICFAGKRVGLKGGLKRVEQELGIARDESVRGFSGYDAVLLWQDYQRGNAQALELLETYNRYDTVNLFELADMVYAKLRQQTGIDGPYVSSRSR